MSKIPVYVIGSYHKDAIAHLQNQSNVSPVLYTDPAKDEWPEKAVGLLMRWDVKLGEAEFAKAPNLKVVVKQGIGVDNIDVEAAKRHGAQVYNTPGVNSEAVAELSLTLALCLGRRVCEIDRAVHRGEKVIRVDWLGRSLFRKVVEVVGMGNVGKEVAKKWLGAMDAKIVAYDPYFPDDGWADLRYMRVKSLGELLKVSDLVTICVPLMAKTKGLIGAEEMALMKDQSILLNMARGRIVDESALLEALKAKKFYGVGLDAMNVEPPTLEMYREYVEHENLIMMPHIGGDTIETQIISGIAAVDTLVLALEGGKPKGREA